MNKATSGPAFPQTYETCKDHMTGMTLRDYFAAKAMQSLLFADLDLIYDEYIVRNSKGQISVALTAYAVADAMLEARK